MQKAGIAVFFAIIQPLMQKNIGRNAYILKHFYGRCIATGDDSIKLMQMQDVSSISFHFLQCCYGISLMSERFHDYNAYFGTVVFRVKVCQVSDTDDSPTLRLDNQSDLSVSIYIIS